MTNMRVYAKLNPVFKPQHFPVIQFKPTRSCKYNENSWTVPKSKTAFYSKCLGLSTWIYFFYSARL